MQEFFHPFHALFVFDFGQRVFHRIDSVIIREVHLSRHIRFLVHIEKMMLFGRAVKDDFLFFRSKVAERYIGAHAQIPGDIFHQGPHQGLPGRHGPFVDSQGIIRHQRILIHGADHARAGTGRTGPFRIKGHRFRTGTVKLFTADGTFRRQHQRYIHVRRAGMSVRTTMTAQAGEQQTETVQQLRGRSKGTADAGDARTLVQGQRSRNMFDLVYLGPARLGDSTPGVSGKSFQVPA